MKNEKRANARILYIDDDLLNAEAFAKRLRRRGFLVEVLEKPDQAISYIEKNQYDLVLLDIVMPNLDGISLLKEIRAKYPPDILPIIMVTVIDDSTDIFDAFEYGANDYITKPLNIDAAAARIHGQLSKTDLHRASTRLKEIEAIAALVITYHHELNNPLAIIQGELQSLSDIRKGGCPPGLEKVFRALDRIKVTLEKIREISEKEDIEFDAYTENSKMVKVQS